MLIVYTQVLLHTYIFFPLLIYTFYDSASLGKLVTAGY